MGEIPEICRRKATSSLGGWGGDIRRRSDEAQIKKSVRQGNAVGGEKKYKAGFSNGKKGRLVILGERT